MENSQEFQPSSLFQASEEHYGRPKKQQKYVSGENNGKWSQIQHAKYIAFIEHNKEKMRSKEKRRVSKLYKEMAKYIKTRNAFQCRSHHQKLEDRHCFSNKIIAHYKKHNDLTLFEEFKLELEELDPQTLVSNTLNVKLQEQNEEISSRSENAGTSSTNALLPNECSTLSSPAPCESVNVTVNENQYGCCPTFEGNSFWGSFYFYPYYTVI